MNIDVVYALNNLAKVFNLINIYIMNNFNGSNPMTSNTDQPIYIFPELKELSSGLSGINKKCGTGVTNENCMADYTNICNSTQVQTNPNCNKLTKRESYTSYANNNINYRYPNRHLGKDLFNVEYNPNFKIEYYENNWRNLFSAINDIIISENNGSEELGFDPGNEKKNVFITGHQHNLQNMFFQLKKTGTKLKYGFRNCTCIKISENQNQIQMKVIHSENTGRDKSKYSYLNKDVNLYDFLNFKPELHDVLKKCNIYIIRHGEAIHNLVDVKNVLHINKYKTEAEYNNQITPGNIEMLNKIGDSEDQGADTNITKGYKAISGVNKPKLNALLTTQGVAQANTLYKTLNPIINKDKGKHLHFKNNIYISSPMDRTIQTLIYATSDNGTGFPFLKKKFLEMYKNRFPITHKELLQQPHQHSQQPHQHSQQQPQQQQQQEEEEEEEQEQQQQQLQLQQQQLQQQQQQQHSQPPLKKSFLSRFNLFKRGGIRRKSRRNMKHKSKKNKRSKKARKTRKHKKQSRKTKKRYSGK